MTLKTIKKADTSFKGNPYNSRNAKAAERRSLAFRYRTASLSYRDILSEMIARFGRDNLPPTYDERYVYRDIKFEMNRLRNETLEGAQDLRLIEMERLDQLQNAIIGDALNGNLKAVDRVLAIMKHRSMLMGLNAPSKTEVAVKDWRSEIIDLIKTGKITIAEAEEELGKDVVAGLLESGRSDVIEGRYSEAESSEE